MRFIRYIILAAVALVLLIVMLANAEPATVRLLPAQFAGIFQLAITLPMFVYFAIMIAAGFFLGYSWEWLREGKHRSEARRGRRDVAELKHEVDTLKKKMGHEDDEILAILK